MNARNDVLVLIIPWLLTVTYKNSEMNSKGIEILNLNMREAQAPSKVSDLLLATRIRLLTQYYVYSVITTTLVIAYYTYLGRSAYFCIMLSAVSAVGLILVYFKQYPFAKAIYTFVIPIVWIYASSFYLPGLYMPIGATLWLALSGLLYDNKKHIVLIGIYYLIGFVAAYKLSYADFDKIPHFEFLDGVSMFLPFLLLVYISYNEFLNVNKQVNESIKQSNLELSIANKDLQLSIEKTSFQHESRMRDIGEDIRNDLGQEIVLLKNQLIRDGVCKEKLSSIDTFLGEVRNLADLLYPRKIELFGLSSSLNSLVKALNKNPNSNLIIAYDEEIEIENHLNQKSKFQFYKMLSLLFDHFNNLKGISYCRVQSIMDSDRVGFQLFFDGSSYLNQNKDLPATPEKMMLLHHLELQKLDLNVDWDRVEMRNVLSLTKKVRL